MNFVNKARGENVHITNSTVCLGFLDLLVMTEKAFVGFAIALEFVKAVPKLRSRMPGK